MASNFVKFLAGQTLTSKELNDNVDFARTELESLGRLIGFGISCGLQGAIEGASVVVAAGLGLDQRGRPVLMPTPRQLPVPPVADATVFPFVDAAQPGFSAVLFLKDTIAASPPCGQADCATHGEIITREPVVVWVPGRLRDTGDNFATDPVHDLELLTITQTSVVVGAFVGLRNGLLKSIDRLARVISRSFDGRAAAVLQSLEQKSTDLPFAKAMKAGLLNQVLLATIDLARCASNHGVCIRNDDPPGLVLGWLEPVAAGFVWRSEFRHLWEPPTGEAAALLGGVGEEPCELLLREIEALLLAFREPVTPAPADPPDVREPPITVCRSSQLLGKCIDIHPVFDEEMKRLVEKVLKKPGWPPSPIDGKKGLLVNPIKLIEELGQPSPLTFSSTLIHIDKGLGFDAVNAKTKIVALAAEHGLSQSAAQASVHVVSQAQAEAMSGFKVQGFAAVGDQVVLVQDEQGKVVNIGHISATATVREQAVTVPAALVEVASAVQTVKAVEQVQIGLVAEFVAVKGFQSDLQATIGAGGLDAFVSSAIQARLVDAIDSRLQPAIDGRVREIVDGRLQGIEDRLEIVGKREAITRERANLGLRTTRTMGQRIDNAYIGSQGTQGAEQTLNTRMLELFGNFTETIRKAAPDDRRDAVNETLKPADAMIKELQEAVAAGGGIFQTEQETVLHIAETMLGALKSTGANPSTLRKVRGSIQGLKGLIG